MKEKFFAILLITVLTSCGVNSTQNKPIQKPLPIVGTWQLISATSTEKEVTTSTFNPKLKMIKIINPTHFAFFQHDLHLGKEADAAFSAGGGVYTLVNNVYTEHLEYFTNRQWENNKFEFTVAIKNDTLTQRGVEKIEKLGIDHIIVEKYVRVTK
jgi:hypothetical protein